MLGSDAHTCQYPQVLKHNTGHLLNVVRLVKPDQSEAEATVCRICSTPNLEELTIPCLSGYADTGAALLARTAHSLAAARHTLTHADSCQKG